MPDDEKKPWYKSWVKLGVIVPAVPAFFAAAMWGYNGIVNHGMALAGSAQTTQQIDSLIRLGELHGKLIGENQLSLSDVNGAVRSVDVDLKDQKENIHHLVFQMDRITAFLMQRASVASPKTFASIPTSQPDFDTDEVP